MKRKNIYLIIIIIVLTAAAAILAALNRPSSPPLSGSVQVTTRAGETLATFSLEDIAALPVTEFSHALASSGHDDQDGVWSGLPVADLLDQAAPGWRDGYATVAARAEDGYVMAFSAGEIAEADNVYLCYMLDGQPLAGRGDGGDGPLRLIVRADRFGTRSLRWLSQVELY